MERIEIYRLLINILRPEDLRRQMEFQPWDAKDEIKYCLEGKGLNILGIGMYSVVVEHPKYKERAFKVSTSRWDGYRAYAKFCTKHSGKPCIPNVYSANEQGNFAWYELDKYYPLVDDAGRIRSEVSNMFNVVYEEAYNSERIKKSNIKDYCSFHRIDESNYESHLKDVADAIKAMRLIRKEFENRFDIDVHDENVMQDKAGNFFITDPLAGDQRRCIPVTEEDPFL